MAGLVSMYEGYGRVADLYGRVGWSHACCFKMAACSSAPDTLAVAAFFCSIIATAAARCSRPFAAAAAAAAATPAPPS